MSQQNLGKKNQCSSTQPFSGSISPASRTGPKAAAIRIRVEEIMLPSILGAFELGTRHRK
jgi:hypothetical protein